MEWYGMSMESTWSVPYGFHGFHGFQMEGCINYDKIELQGGWGESVMKECNGEEGE